MPEKVAGTVEASSWYWILQYHTWRTFPHILRTGLWSPLVNGKDMRMETYLLIEKVVFIDSVLKLQ